MSEFREYENGVADVLCSIVGEAAEVQRNVHLASRSGIGTRQVDVAVRGRIFGFSDGLLVVDCKRWAKKIDIKDVDAFVGTLDDVGADLGMLISSAGSTPAAQARAKSARGVKVATLSVGDLSRWRPPGTVTYTYEIATGREVELARALRNLGYRVAFSEGSDVGRVLMDVFRHYGTRSPSGEVQGEQSTQACRVLDSLGVEYVGRSSGISIGGGTPGHRWIQVLVAGQPFVKILAATWDEFNSQLDGVVSHFGIPRELITADVPEGWPFAGPFDL